MLKEQLLLIKRLHGNPTAQRVLILMVIVYLLSPIDIIPDAVPVVGWLDDASILLVEIAQFVAYMKKKKSEYNTQVKQEVSNENGENK